MKPGRRSTTYLVRSQSKTFMKWLGLIRLSLYASGFCLYAPALFALEDFHQSTLSQLEQDNAGKAWWLLLWSIDCPPCYKELEHLSQLVQSGHSDAIVLVSVDAPEQGAAVQEVLIEFGLQGINSYQFGTGNRTALQYQVDPSWAGVLPRAYAYSAQGLRSSYNGVLGFNELVQHLYTSAAEDSLSAPQSSPPALPD